MRRFKRPYPSEFRARIVGRRTWKHPNHTGQPTHLPANAPGELEIWVEIGDAKSHDEPARYTFRDVRVPSAGDARGVAGTGGRASSAGPGERTFNPRS